MAALNSAVAEVDTDSGNALFFLHSSVFSHFLAYCNCLLTSFSFARHLCGWLRSVLEQLCDELSDFSGLQVSAF